MDFVELNSNWDGVGEDIVVEIVEAEKWDRGCGYAAGCRRIVAGMRGREVSSGSWGKGLSVGILVFLMGEARSPDGGGESGVNPLSTNEMRLKWLAKLSSSSASSTISSGISSSEEV